MELLLLKMTDLQASQLSNDDRVITKSFPSENATSLFKFIGDG